VSFINSRVLSVVGSTCASSLSISLHAVAHVSATVWFMRRPNHCTMCALQGYDSEGCEHSWFMLIASAFILNKASCAEEFTVHPFVHSSNNQPSTAAQLRGVRTYGEFCHVGQCAETSTMMHSAQCTAAMADLSGKAY